MSYEISGKRVWVAGHRGMVGAAIARRLQNESCEVLRVGRDQVDLRRQADVERWIGEEKPEVIFLAAAKVGGIHANTTFPVDFLYDNLMIELNIIRAAHETGVEKLLFLGSSCIYPRDAPQPITEDALLQGALEPTNEWYATGVDGNTDMVGAAITGTAPVAGAFQVFRIEVDADGETCRFYIDGVLEISGTATCVAASTNIFPYISVNSTTTGVETIDIDYIYVGHTR